MLKLTARCRHVMHMLGWQPQQPHPAAASMVLEHCDIGDLRDLKKSHENFSVEFPEGLTWHVLKSVSLALAFLATGHGTENYGHGSWVSIVHRDIKPANILLKRDSTSPFPQVKLTDLGIAGLSGRHGYQEDVHDSRVGTPFWQAPEFPKSSTSADLWALGAVVDFLALKVTPYDAAEYMRAVGTRWAVRNSTRATMWILKISEYSEPVRGESRRATYSVTLDNLMQLCLVQQPSSRPHIMQFLGKVVEARRVWTGSQIVPVWAMPQSYHGFAQTTPRIEPAQQHYIPQTRQVIPVQRPAFQIQPLMQPGYPFQAAIAQERIQMQTLINDNALHLGQGLYHRMDNPPEYPAPMLQSPSWQFLQALLAPLTQAQNPRRLHRYSPCKRNSQLQFHKPFRNCKSLYSPVCPRSVNSFRTRPLNV